MRRNRVVEQLLDSAQHGHRCAYACNRNERVALARRARSGELNQVFRNCYVRPDYWDSLRPAERTWHICRTVNQYNPGVVFDGFGNRAGYGKGYYDRYFSTHEYQKLIGVAYEASVFEQLPSQGRDLKMDFLCTEERLYCFK